MKKKLLAMAASAVVAVATVTTGAVAVSAAPASSGNVRAECQDDNYDPFGGVQSSLENSLVKGNKLGYLGNFTPGNSYVCFFGGFVNRGLPLVTAAIQNDDVWMSPSAPASRNPATRVGTGAFRRDGIGLMKITIPKKQPYGYGYTITFVNVFDRSQSGTGYLCIGSYDYCSI